jgi:hypothetical protein
MTDAFCSTIWRIVFTKPQADKISLDAQLAEGKQFAAAIGDIVVATYTVCPATLAICGAGKAIPKLLRILASITAQSQVTCCELAA